MKMRFKNNSEPCVQYLLLDVEPVMEYDEIVFKKYVPHLLLGVLGLIPMELLMETSHPDNIDAIDVATYIQTH